jgi:hypothetical protein
LNLTFSDQLSKSAISEIAICILYSRLGSASVYIPDKFVCVVSEALRAGLRSGNAEVRAFFWLYLPGICGDLGLTSPELPHTEAAVCLGLFADRFLLFSQWLY